MTDQRMTEPPTLDELRAIVAGVIGFEPATIGPDDNLIHLGIDSLGMMRVLNRLRRTGVRLSVRELVTDPTLAAWHRYASSAIGRAIDDGLRRPPAT